MTTTNATHKAASAKPAAKSKVKHMAEELTKNADGILCEVVSWNARPVNGSGNHKHSAVVNALKLAGLNHEVAKEFLPQHAFARAARKLADQRVIDVLRDDKDEVVFQFTKKFVSDHAGESEWTFAKETNLHLNKTTGKVACKITELQQKAQEELDKAMEERTTADITRIIQKLFEAAGGDLIPFREQGGVYIVPKEHLPFCDQIDSFMVQLTGRTMNRLPIVAGTKRGDTTVAASIKDYLEGLVKDYEDAVQGWTVNTKKTTVEKQSERFKDARSKLKAYASYLGELVEEIEPKIQQGEQVLKNQIMRIGQARTEQGDSAETTSRAKVLGKYSLTAFIRWCGSYDWSMEEVKRVLKKMGIEAAESTIQTQLVGVKSGSRGDPAELSEDEVLQVYDILEG